ncbi:MAG: glutathione S-transferase family protein [Pseudomonadales bacterium]|jgi:glutathione S-transferase|nr:glutathione S-transferase family protein [Pseudomonadales bacterium]
MLTLHGFSYSNYYNIPKHALLYKRVPFEEDLVYPSGEGYARFSPAKKVPSLTTEDGRHLSEAAVLCEYIEDAYPEPALLPADPWARNHVRQIMHMAELYLELPCRRLLPFSFTNATPPEALCAEVGAVVDRGVASMNALCDIDPFLTGRALTMADIYVRYVFQVVDLGSRLLKRDIEGEIGGLGAWRARMAADPVSRRVDADTEANREGFFAYIASLR